MAYSENPSDIIVWEKFEVNCIKKANIAFALALPKSKKGHNSFKGLQMISKFALDLYFMMLYPFEWNWCIPSKFIDLKPKVWGPYDHA